MSSPQRAAASAYITPPSSTKKSGRSSMESSQSPPPSAPPAPNPARDAGAYPSEPIDFSEDLTHYLSSETDTDIFALPPVVALKLMCRCIENLVELTGDVPPTPPINLGQAPAPDPQEEALHFTSDHDSTTSHDDSSNPISPTGPDGAPLRRTPIGSPEAHHEPFPIIGTHTHSERAQHDAITRKFYSKRPPPISLEDYLGRLHRYCPMSTAVYLAVSLYVWRLAMVERTLPVTRRNVHRLLLAGLRVGMKALEDHSFHHSRFAKVGGVSEKELARLEISFCFVTDFDLKVSKEMLVSQAKQLRDFAKVQGKQQEFEFKLPLRRRSSGAAGEGKNGGGG